MTDDRLPNGVGAPADGAAVGPPGANWRTMMATFVTRLERDHETLLEALRERLDEAEARSRALEARLAALEAALEASREASRQSAGQAAAAQVGATGAGAGGGEKGAAAAAAAPATSRALPEGSAAGPGALPPERAGADGAAARPPWQGAADAMLRREAEVLTRAARGDSVRDIAAALGRGVGEVELVLRLAERAGHSAIALGQPTRGGM